MPIIFLVCVAAHLLRQTCEVIFPEEENNPSSRVARLCRHFSLAEIQSATKNFKDTFIIGKGGFGIVYKGFLDATRETVAVKRLKSDSKQGKREFWKEIETLSELRHSNLVPLIGYCNEHDEMILVYAYMPNGTLADHLYKLARKNKSHSFLSWEDRLKICIGAGRGLDYLHTGHGVIHRDVKASNILLDETFVAKVSDFGLVKSEKEIQSQSQESSNPKGTFGYFDPDYFRTCKLTMKSDTYSFGVVLLEVLCGRPAVDPLAGEDMRSLTMWALDNIRRGEVDQIVTASLGAEISPESLKVFVGIVEKCLLDEPKRRPTIAHVIINLEFALEQQSFKFFSPSGISRVADSLPCIDKAHVEGTKSLLPHETTRTSDFLPHTNRTLMSTRNVTVASSNMQTSTFLLNGQSNSRRLNAVGTYGKKEDKKSIMRKLSRLLPWEKKAWTRAIVSKKNEFGGISMSAPISKNSSGKTSPSRGTAAYQNQRFSIASGGNDLSSMPNFRIFSFSELKAATRNFRNDLCIGKGGFGSVFKGYFEEKLSDGNGKGTGFSVAIKRLTPESKQGFEEWLAEVNFLGRLAHPNLVKLLGYCSENEELLLVYEFIENGSLDQHLFRRRSASQSLSWNIRLKILIGAARGMAFLHSVSVVHRDFKTSNLLLDGSYNAKLIDFGFARSGPNGERSHVTTRVIGTFCYAAPEYVATGHLTVKSDVYAFGVTLLEILTGLQALDRNRPPEQENLVEWIKTQLKNRINLKKIMDSRLEGNYPPKSAKKLLQLAGNCLTHEHKTRPSMQEVVEILERIDIADGKSREPRVSFNDQATNNPHM